MHSPSPFHLTHAHIIAQADWLHLVCVVCRFLLLLCKELQRLNSFIAKLADDKFNRIDVQRAGQVSQMPSRDNFSGFAYICTTAYRLGTLTSAAMKHGACLNQGFSHHPSTGLCRPSKAVSMHRYQVARA